MIRNILSALIVFAAVLDSDSAARSAATQPANDIVRRLAVQTGVYDKSAKGTTPQFLVDPTWPLPLPHDWILGQVGGLYVDRHDNIWVYNRPRTLTNDEAGLEAVESARQDGRWEAAYASQSKAVTPDDLQAELDRNAGAKAFFAALDSRNRYAILHRIHTAKKAETRARRIEQFVRMLANEEKIYP